MLVDPWGAVCAQLAEGEGLAAGEIDLDSMMGIRTSLPALQHRTL
jgi:nitrilase